MSHLSEIKRRANVKTAGAVLLVLLLALTFLSKTVYNFNLPVVTAVSPIEGKLDKLETATGIAEWADLTEVYTGTSGFVKEIFVKEGDRVTKGQVILQMEQTEEDLSAKRDSEYELQQVETDIRNGEEDCSRQKKLYEQGAVPRSEYEKLERDLQTLYAKKDKLLDDQQQGGLNPDLLTVRAPADSVVSDLSVHGGQKLGSGDQVAVLGLPGAFQINCSISLDNNFVTEGDSCKIDNTSHSFDGTVTEVKAEDGKKTVSIRLQSDSVKEGETFTVKFEKESAESHTLVPNGALRKDADGYFLYQVKQRDGMLGKEYYVEVQRVYIGDNDDEYTVISKGVTFFEPIVLRCDKDLSKGDAVILENEGDFFAE
jgi:RND family efflux transporter, MFP subunit